MYEKLSDILPEHRIFYQEPLSRHTTFKVGGPADILVCPESVTEIQRLIGYCREKNLSYTIVGLGSNLLVRDKGYRGMVIKLGHSLRGLYITGEEIMAEAGIRLSELSKKAAAQHLSGLEFAEGIPGSLGGAVVMNAGAYNGEMRQVLVAASAIDGEGNLRTFPAEELQFGYRTSLFQKGDWVVVSALLKLESGRREEIESRMREFARHRREKQPLDMPSAGSTFKRPPGVYVGPLLEKMGLKGYRLGGAEVSAKHAGFIVNTGQATAQEIIDLISYIQQRARDEYHLHLEPEIRIIGEE